MGKIHLHAFRTEQAIHNERTGEDNKGEDKKNKRGPIIAHAEHIESIEIEKQENSYSIWPKTTRQADLPFLSPKEVKKQSGKGGSRLWIVVDNIILDVTEYQHKHPGGRSIIQGFGGQDCSWQWWSFHDRSIWKAVGASLRVGRTEGVQNRHQRPPAIVGLRGFGFDDWD